MRKMPKNRWVFAAGLPVALVLLFILGPRPEVSEKLPDLALPADLKSYIHMSEEKMPDITPGTEKTIIWARPDKKEKTNLSIVYLHGFSATRQETAPLGERVAAELGANLFYTRLRGHGRSGQALGEVVVNDWLSNGQEAMAIGKRLGERVLLIGSSTGGTLCAWISLQPQWRPHILAVVLISPNFGPRDARSQILLWPWGLHITRIAVGSTRCFRSVNGRHATYWTTCYPIEALLPMMALVQLVGSKDFFQISNPVLVLYSEDDQVVDTGKLKAAFDKIGTSQKVLTEVIGVDDPSHQVLAGDILSPSTTDRVADEIVRFAQSLID